MKYIWIALFSMAFNPGLLAQDLSRQSGKPSIDSSVYGKWPEINNYSISNDGNFAVYSIYNRPIAGDVTLVILSIHTNWRIELQMHDISWGYFTQDSRRFVFIKSQDSLCILTLGISSIEYIPNVRTFKFIRKGNDEWLAYQLITPEKKLIVRNMRTGTQMTFNSVISYLVGNGVLMLQTEVKYGTVIKQALQWIDLTNQITAKVWEGEHATGFTFDKTGTECAFKAEAKLGAKRGTSLWYYKLGMTNARMLADDYSPGIGSGLILGDIERFSNDGNRLFFKLKEVDTPKLNVNLVQVDVWSYKDPKMQSEQLYDMTPHSYWALIRVSDKRIIRLERDASEVNSFECPKENEEDTLGIVRKNMGGSRGEWKWNPATRTSIYLESTDDGSRRLIQKDISEPVGGTYKLSPAGKYLIYYDGALKNYFIYNISTGVIRDITVGIKGAWTTNGQDDIPASDYRPIGCAGWLKDDFAVLIYDQHDIFQVDPLGKIPPVNLTNGYGRRFNIVFRVVENETRSKPITNVGQKIILNAFNIDNKDNGFYSITLGKRGDPDSLSMQPYIFDGADESLFGPTSYPIKARDVENYIVKRQSASESPNLFYTSDFKTFNRLSNIAPEKEYNWMTSELITWKTLNGSLSQGILYKPDDFNPKKKYPIIFFYYEKFSETLHEFREPEANGAEIDIPSFVSGGYLVFVPDVHYQVGTGQGEGVYNSVVSAAEYLSRMSWIDKTRMGINGHSRGGFETDYLITHTHIFAAAISGSGYCDLISLYDGVHTDGSSRQDACELGSLRIGATLWQRPDLYLDNSPVLRADKVTTPLLMMNNKMDGDIPFTEGLEFFTALRRLGKKVWMLQYDGQGHLVGGAAADDLSIRMKQFFDYYLKKTAAPKWMMNGIPASMKGVDLGLDLDRSGVVP